MYLEDSMIRDGSWNSITWSRTPTEQSEVELVGRPLTTLLHQLVGQTQPPVGPQNGDGRNVSRRFIFILGLFVPVKYQPGLTLSQRGFGNEARNSHLGEDVAYYPTPGVDSDIR
jgi:hypothetical protein